MGYDRTAFAAIHLHASTRPLSFVALSLTRWCTRVQALSARRPARVATSVAAGAAGGAAASAFPKVAAEIGKYLAGSAALKLAAKGGLFLAKKTPHGRAASVAYAAYKAARMAQKGTKALKRGEIVTKLLKAAF